MHTCRPCGTECVVRPGGGSGRRAHRRGPLRGCMSWSRMRRCGLRLTGSTGLMSCSDLGNMHAHTVSLCMLALLMYAAMGRRASRARRVSRGRRISGGGRMRCKGTGRLTQGGARRGKHSVRGVRCRCHSGFHGSLKRMKRLYRTYRQMGRWGADGRGRAPPKWG